MKELLKALNESTVAFQPVYKRITGSATAAILLSQLMYWWAKVDGREFYKTDQEIMEETALTEKELRNAKEKLRALPFIKMTLHGVPPKTYYLIDHEGLTKSILENPRSNSAQRANLNSAQRAKTKPPKGRNSVRPKGENNTVEYTREYSGECAPTQPKTEKLKPTLNERTEAAKAQSPGLDREEYTVMAVMAELEEYFAAYPAMKSAIITNLKNRAKLLEIAGNGKSVFRAEVEAWVRYNVKNPVFVSDPSTNIATGANSLKSWLSRWDGYADRDKKKDTGVYQAPENLFG